MQAPTVGGREFPLSSSQGFWTIDVLQVSMNNGGKGKAGLQEGLGRMPVCGHKDLMILR